MILLSIVIPTRNRRSEIQSLITILANLFEETNSITQVEIIVSNNSKTYLHNFETKNLRIVTPEKEFKTAEENLFSLFREAKGKYVWPLGDDDIPNSRAFKKLLQICEAGEIDAMTWNSRIIGIYGEPIGHSRVEAETEFVYMKYSAFLERMGYWSIPAAISLTIFRNELNNFNILSEITSLESPIYSHVTYYAAIFHDKNFTFVNEVLVDYQTNRHDVQKKAGYHWTEFSANQETYFRYPWISGMIKQLKYLESKGFIQQHYIASALDISHFGKRFRLVDHIVAMLFEQIMIENTKKTVKKIHIDELQEIIKFISKSEPRFARYFELFLRIKESNKRMPSSIYLELESHQKYFLQSIERMPFHSFYRNTRFGYLIYETPLGWLGLKPHLDVDKNTLNNPASYEVNLIKDLVGTLSYALHGITIPSNFRYSAKSEAELLEILNKEEYGATIDYIMFNSLKASNEFYGYSIHQNSTRARKIWIKLPQFIRRFLKGYFF